MKTSKKVLGVVLTLIMLVNVFAVSVFAAYPDDAACALIVKTDKANYAPGDEVVLTVAVKATADVGPMLLTGQYELGYNSAVLEPYAASDTTLEGHGFAADAYFAGAYDASMSQVIYSETTMANGGSVTAGKGWDSVILYCVADNGSISKDCADAEATLFTVKMKIAANAADGTYTIGFNQDGYETNFTAYATDLNGGGLYGNDGSGFGKANLYDFGVAEFTVGEGGSTGPDQPTEINVAVKNLDPKVQWRAAGSNDLYIGFEGELSGFTKDQAATVIASITDLGIEFSSTDATLATSIKATTNVVYDFTADDAGVYKFRAVVRKAMTDADAAGTITHNLYARAYVTIGDKAPITASDIISTTIYDEYTEGVAGGLATLAANLG